MMENKLFAVIHDSPPVSFTRRPRKTKSMLIILLAICSGLYYLDLLPSSDTVKIPPSILPLRNNHPPLSEFIRDPKEFGDGGPPIISNPPVFKDIGELPYKNEDMVVPDILHYIWISGSAKKPLEYFQYLAIKSGLDRLNVSLAIMHCDREPGGVWWDLLKVRFTISHVEEPTHIYGREIYYGAHKSDVLRLLILQHYGGIYLDSDVYVVRSMDELMYHPTTIGHQPPWGLCNAIQLSAPHAEFYNRWIDSYRSYKPDIWDHNSVVTPLQIASKYKEEIQVVDEKAMYWPNCWDFDIHLSNEYNFTATNQYTYHGWHSGNGGRYLENVTPEDILSVNTSFNILVRDLVSPDDVRIWREGASKHVG